MKKTVCKQENSRKNYKQYACPICGYDMREAFGRGDICPCCGNEFGFDDYMHIRTVYERYSKETITTCCPEIMKEVDHERIIDKTFAWNLLRDQWLKKGTPFVYPREHMEWSHEKAIEQLKRIGKL